jgi:hypothetical protein|tara:strand:- start:599 stop:922 length:324 start_codon:yes stop_codon:yes gene_type:complete
MAVKKRIVRKKKKNEASEALAKISGIEELERATIILKELAKRNQRKENIKDKKQTLEKIKKEKTKPQKVQNNVENEKINRLKELDNLRKNGILTNQEFEKLKSDLIN